MVDKNSNPFVDIKEKWESRACSMILGKKVIKVEYIPTDECKDYGWYSKPISIIFNDGTRLIAMCDDEGNSCGALHTSFENVRCFPQLREED